jgi:membrane associated rhomboid family serine protease
MNQASVGFHCPDCAQSGKQKVVRGPAGFDPIVTKVIIGLNLLGVVWATSKGSSLFNLGTEALVDGGLAAAFRAPGGAVEGVDFGDTYRLVSSAFLHDGLMHIGFNMYALWILGPMLERLLGRPRFIALYATALLGGSFGVLLVDPVQLTVGASGAVFGLMGAVLVVQRAAGLNIWQTPLAPVLGINLLLTFAVPQISIGGHVGGLIAGAAIGVVMVASIRKQLSEWIAVGAAVAMSAALVAGSLWAAAQWQDPFF